MLIKYKLYIHIKGNQKLTVDDVSNKIANSSRTLKFNTIGPLKLPTKTKLFTVLTSPHVHKKSRDQFNFQISKRLIILSFSNKDYISLKLLTNLIHISANNTVIKIKFVKQICLEGIEPSTYRSVV